jgi:hypothetical protein
MNLTQEQLLAMERQAFARRATKRTADRERVANELLRRLEVDLANHEDYDIGEQKVRALIERFRNDEPIPVVEKAR